MVRRLSISFLDKKSPRGVRAILSCKISASLHTVVSVRGSRGMGYLLSGRRGYLRFGRGGFGGAEEEGVF